MPAISSSSHVASVEHNGRALVVRFKNGAEYHYAGVPRFLYARLVNEMEGGASVGRFLNQHIFPHYQGQQRRQE